MPLHRQFRYIHEPLPVDDDAIPVLGHHELVTSLRERLTYSHGGTFLVTGFRGVGKSTLVLRALSAAADQAHQVGGYRLLTVHLNFARKMEADQLLFAVVRRIFETLGDEGLLRQLPHDVQESLLLAYTRTSLSFKQTQAEGSEHGGTLGVGPQIGPLASLAPALSITGRRTSNRATEAAFLAYSETDVEHDLLRIIQLLGDIQEHPAPRRRRWPRRRRQPGRLRVHPVIVLDEVDKLTDSSADALPYLETLLGTLKNVLTARGAHFILVAGPDLHDQALRDADRGNGVYESVFSWRMYVPCLWSAPERLVRGLHEAHQVEHLRSRPPLRPPPRNWPPGRTWDGRDPGSRPDDAPDEEPAGLDTLVEYLRFKSRGVPRRLLQEFNALVAWDTSGHPLLRVPDEDWPRMLFYGYLQSVVSDAISAGTTTTAAPLPIDNDRWRLGGYHVVDWALRSRGRVFTATDVARDGQLDPLLRMDAPTVERLLRHLVHRDVLDVVSEGSRPDATDYGNPADARITYYRLTDAYSRQLAGFAWRSESERADLHLTTPPLRGPWDTTLTRRPPPAADPSVTGALAAPAVVPEPAVSPVVRLGDRYEALSPIGAGGMGVVYRGRDLRTGEDVAIKLLHRGLTTDETMVARFRREAQIGMRMRHPNIAHTIDVVDTPEHALIIELIEGSVLTHVLSAHGALTPQEAARIGNDLGEALQYLHSLGLYRIDIKPANVVLHPTRGAVIIDLGVARALEEAGGQLTLTGVIIGSPLYMAPEQVRGQVDIRSDLYALGTVLYQCLTGRLPHEYTDAASILYAVAHEDVSVDGIPASAALRDVLRRCLVRDPDLRYQQPQDFLTDLRAAPEVGEAAGR
ncbi:serine/threonine-protein kinase [Streptomyces sp. NPDC006733]|uniref:serine/threonine-protein kinase n=1 Tax=Streptomyces sp. NPDC006733 TaxID=3155460 RepID=UPI0033E5137D